jgi:aminoglycoside/choline kinase family phosphotransferase
VHLLDRLKSGSPRRNRSDMAQVLEVTARLHDLHVPGSVSLEPAFSPALYRWEHRLFEEEFLTRHDPTANPVSLHGELLQVAEALQGEPQVLVHRDLQSTNFLWRDNQPMLIDAQGMRLGPAAYDLASLLADPYVDREPDEQLALLNHYNQMAKVPVAPEAYALGATQRLVQALGAYGRLGAQPATRRFLHFVPAAVRQLGFWAPEEGALKAWAEAFFVRHPTEFTL